MNASSASSPAALTSGNSSDSHGILEDGIESDVEIVACELRCSNESAEAERNGMLGVVLKLRIFFGFRCFSSGLTD